MSYDSMRHPENYPLDPAARAFSKDKEAVIKLIGDPMCECGDPSSQHVDGCEQCFIVDCGCKEFTNVEEEI